jgi:hypothetical protein
MTKNDDLRLKRFVRDAIVQKMELEIYGVKVDMQYTAAANLVGSRHAPSSQQLYETNRAPGGKTLECFLRTQSYFTSLPPA